VSLLPLDVEHPRYQRALEPCARAAQDIETRAGEFYAAIEIDDSEILAEFPMRERLERGELYRRSLGSDYAVVGLAGADNDVRPRDIGKCKRQFLDLPLCETKICAQLQQRVADIFRYGGVGEKLVQFLFVGFLSANFGDLGGAFLRRQLADFPRAALAIGADLIEFALKLATLLVNFEQSVDFSGIDPPLGQFALYEIGPFTNQLDIQHSECVPQQFNFQPLARRVNRHDIEAHLDFVRAIAPRKHF